MPQGNVIKQKKKVTFFIESTLTSSSDSCNFTRKVTNTPPPNNDFYNQRKVSFSEENILPSEDDSSYTTTESGVNSPEGSDNEFNLKETDSSQQFDFISDSEEDSRDTIPPQQSQSPHEFYNFTFTEQDINKNINLINYNSRKQKITFVDCKFTSSEKQNGAINIFHHIMRAIGEANPNLTELHMNNTDWSGRSFPTTYFQNLKEITFEKYTYQAGQLVNTANNLPTSIRHVKFVNCKNPDIDSFSANPYLTTITISNCNFDAPQNKLMHLILEFAKKCVKISDIYINTLSISHADLEYFHLFKDSVSKEIKHDIHIHIIETGNNKTYSFMLQ